MIQATGRAGLLAEMPLSRLCAAAGLACPPKASRIPVFELCTDSRRAGPGSLFFAVPGSRDDGAHHVEEAVHKGAVALVVPAGSRVAQDVRVPCIVAADVRRVKALIAAEFFGHPS